MIGLARRNEAWACVCKRADVAIPIGLFAYAVAVWWPTRALPYYWDGAAFVVDAARDMLRAHFTPFVPTHAYFAHPPLFIAIVAAAWGLFGESRVVAHAVVFPFLPLAMGALYFLGKCLHGRLLGAAAAILFGAMPLVLAEYGQIYFDLPIAAVVVCGLFAWVAHRRATAGVLFAVAAAMKIPAVIVPGSLLVTLALSREHRREVRAYAALAPPFAIVVAWLVYHHQVTGWWFSNGDRARYVPTGATSIAEHAAILFRSCFIAQFRWVLLAGGAVAAIVLRRRGERVFAPSLVALLACVLGGVAFFVSTNVFLTRYILLILPPYVTGVLLLVRRALVRAPAFAAFTGATLVAFVFRWHPQIAYTSRYELQPNEDLSYLDMIGIGRAAAGYVAKNHVDAEIYGGFHEIYQLTEPWQGYLEQPLAVSTCGRFERHAGVKQVVYIHGYEPEQIACHEVVNETGARAIKRFESNGKWLEIWRLPTAP
jgi:4-amino-4-deoxy-L-arabinose transferase-like glycosyltransferase